MPSLSQTIVKNVEANYIEIYLKSKNCVRSEEEKGIAVNYWVDRLFQEQKIDKEDFENFLFQELFWGKENIFGSINWIISIELKLLQIGWSY